MNVERSSSLKKITIAVLVFHMAVILILFIPLKSKKSAKKITIHEKRLPSKKSPAVKPSSPIPKNSVSKPFVYKSKKKAQSKNKTLNSLEKSLDLLSKKTTFTKPLHVPKMIHLSIEKPASQNTTTFSYERALIEFLQSSLEFKNPGQVKMEITIEQKGTLIKSKTLCSESIENESYLKNRLRKLSFPCFNAYDISEKHLTFVVNFCSD